MDTKERLKHASEVLSWLAEGKTVQGKHAMARDVWEDLQIPNPLGIARLVLDGTYIYRIKPEPVERCAYAVHAGLGVAVPLPGDVFRSGQRVKVTVLES